MCEQQKKRKTMQPQLKKLIKKNEQKKSERRSIEMNSVQQFHVCRLHADNKKNNTILSNDGDRQKECTTSVKSNHMRHIRNAEQLLRSNYATATVGNTGFVSQFVIASQGTEENWRENFKSTVSLCSSFILQSEII